MQTSLTFATDNRLPEILGRLSATYPSARQTLSDPLAQLIFGVIGEGAAPPVGLAVFNRVRARWPHWVALSNVSAEDLAPFFIGLPRATKKAAAVPAILRQIAEEKGAIDISFLAKLSTDAGQRWLERLPGVSSGVAAAVLAFSSLARPLVTIDADNARVIRRLELCSMGAPLSAVPRHVSERAPAAWGSDQFSKLSDGLRRLARSVCHAGKPACGDCPLAELCPSQTRNTATVIRFPFGESKDERAVS
ncbi:hypothetical protein [Parvularcula sp. LCG005]|uniref:endonuclease III domain-containing protein n=1 Tax=Parvularcula sp. LCG005 TaxID=3078805 RepID=UPI0029439C1B|nr:hypothetical protein [Parvularcula sp. LCG005]WOI54767.1 hypothetical protein RUI03_07125 [Parvularcula sp. LCG005]